MSIALFAEPIEAEWITSFNGGYANLSPCMLLGVIEGSTDDRALIVVGDGTLRWIDASDVVTKWRYDEAEKDWIDHSGPPGEVEEVE